MSAYTAKRLAEIGYENEREAEHLLLIASQQRVRELTALLEEGLECVETAIASGDWEVDGACDPDSWLYRVRKSIG